MRIFSQGFHSEYTTHCVQVIKALSFGLTWGMGEREERSEREDVSGMLSKHRAIWDIFPGFVRSTSV